MKDGSCNVWYGKGTAALAMEVIVNVEEGSCIIIIVIAIVIKGLDNGASGSGKALLLRFSF